MDDTLEYQVADLRTSFEDLNRDVRAVIAALEPGLLSPKIAEFLETLDCLEPETILDDDMFWSIWDGLIYQVLPEIPSSPRRGRLQKAEHHTRAGPARSSGYPQSPPIPKGKRASLRPQQAYC